MPSSDFVQASGSTGWGCGDERFRTSLVADGTDVRPA